MAESSTMSEPFAASTRSIIADAVKLSADRGHGFITTGHLLYALLKDDRHSIDDVFGLRSLDALSFSGANIEQLISDLDEGLEQYISLIDTKEHPEYSLTESSKLVLQGAFMCAAEEKGRIGSEFINPLHLLTSLFENYSEITRDADDIAYMVLNAHAIFNRYLEKINRGLDTSINRVHVMTLFEDYKADLERKESEQQQIEQMNEARIKSYIGKVVAVREGNYVVGILVGYEQGRFDLRDAVEFNSSLTSQEQALELYASVLPKIKALNAVGVTGFSESLLTSFCMAEVSCQEDCQEDLLQNR